MSVYKDNVTGKWRVIYRYTDITGKRKQTQKRGFETKREAVAWEHEIMLKSQAKLDMTFGSFYEIYEADKASRLKQSTWETKSHIIRTKILPYFVDRKIDEIEVRDVIAWQNELLAAFKDEGKEERYSQDYLRTIQRYHLFDNNKIDVENNPILRRITYIVFPVWDLKGLVEEFQKMI